MRYRYPYLVIAATALVMLCATGAHAGLHVLLSAPGVSGSFVGEQYSGWVEGLDFQHNVPGLPKPLALMSGTVPALETGAFTYPAGKTVSFTKTLDKSSAILSALCSSGSLIPSMRLALCRSVDTGLTTVLTLNFEEVKICRYAVLAPGFGDPNLLIPAEEGAATELLLLMPKTVRWKYKR